MLIEQYCKRDKDILTLRVPLEDYMFNHILTGNSVMIEQVEKINKIAGSSTAVLITGETGTGKELYAEYIHQTSVRKKRSYAKVNCATIPEKLFESEMFGYVPGAFTGALKTGKKGFFEIADGGTLFLDEIGELPLSLQSKLLRVLQENVFTKIGSSAEIKTDVRIIAATNKDLHEMATEGVFRKDLFYRLNVIPITLLPLRDRQEDILLLTFYFVRVFNEIYCGEKQVSEKLMRAFLDYMWPGNVRELRNTVERLVLLSDEKVLTDISILEESFEKNVMFSLDDSNMDGIMPVRVRDLQSREKSLKEIVSEYEIFIIKEYMKEYGSLRKAAAALKTSPSVLSRKLRR